MIRSGDRLAAGACLWPGVPDIFTLRNFLESLSLLRSPQKSGEFLANSPRSLRTNSEIFQGEPLQKLSTKNRVFYIS